MYKLNKVYPGGKQVIKDISLSFLPGAKIGVLGGNGAGKSTLLKIMAGLDTDYNGDATLAEGIKVGYLAQEPELNNELNVYENVMEGMAEAKKIVDDFNAISLKFSEDLSEDEMNETILKQAELQETIDNMDAWDLDRKAEIAMDALSLPPASEKIDHLSGGEKRRVALAKLLLSNPDFLLFTKEAEDFKRGDILDWVNEIHSYTNQIYAGVSVDDKLGYEYQYKNFGTVKDLLLTGGIRLAKILNYLFD